nr:reverse transcriptase domain-containing protein [Tanacetum cinerariifolium]
CGFSELRCKALADLGASINLMPLSVWIKLGLPDLIPTQMTLKLANHAICTPDGIARDVFVPVASYSNHPYKESVNLINIFNLSSEDCLKDLVSNKQSGNPTFSLHKEIASPEVIPEIHDSKGCSFLSEELPDIDSFNDIHPYFDDDPLSGSTTYSANSLLEEFADELALISYPLDYDDYRACDIESDIREIEFFLFQSEDFDFKDSIDQSVLTHFDDLFVDPTPEMFAEEQPPDYSFPPRFDVYPDDFLEIESDATFDDDSFDSEGETIKEAELLIDPLDLPCDILSEYDSFNSQDFSRDDVLFSPDNEDKVFNPGILSHDKSVKIITRFTQEKKLVVFFDYLLSEDFDPPFSELLAFKEVPISMRLLPFSSENEEKVFKPGIYTFKKFHCCFLSELSHSVFLVIVSSIKIDFIFLPKYQSAYKSTNLTSLVGIRPGESLFATPDILISHSTTTHSDISLPDYEAFSFDDDHIKEISSGSTTTQTDISRFEYDSFIFDLTHEKFVDELAHIISPPEYDRFYFSNLPDPGELMSVLNSEIRENLSTTLMNLPIEVDYSPLLAYVVWIFVAYLT